MLKELNGTGYCHNAFYRNKNLGTIDSTAAADAFVSTHKITTSEFYDIYPGDEITIQDGVYNATWLVAGVNTHIEHARYGNLTPHICLFAKDPIVNASMNETDTTVGGYQNSAMNKTILPEISKNLSKVLGSHLFLHSVLMNAMVDDFIPSMAGKNLKGGVNGWNWVDTNIYLPSEAEILGTGIMGSSYMSYGEGVWQLPLFRFAFPHALTSASKPFWLRDVACVGSFSYLSPPGNLDPLPASAKSNVRPIILLK